MPGDDGNVQRDGLRIIDEGGPIGQGGEGELRPRFLQRLFFPPDGTTFLSAKGSTALSMPAAEKKGQTK
jgi:hypothetical protein